MTGVPKTLHPKTGFWNPAIRISVNRLRPVIPFVLAYRVSLGLRSKYYRCLKLVYG